MQSKKLNNVEIITRAAIEYRHTRQQRVKIINVYPHFDPNSYPDNLITNPNRYTAFNSSALYTPSPLKSNDDLCEERI